MTAHALSATPFGIEARLVEVEVDVRCALPHFTLVGLPDSAVRESRDRVRAAVSNCGFRLDPRAVVVNLAPADLRKEGNHLDLAIALALLAAYELLPGSALVGRLFCGELGLDGALRPIRGALGIAELAGRQGARELLLPAANAEQAACLGALPVIPVAGLSAAIEHVLGKRSLPPAAAAGRGPPPRQPLDLADVRGQELPKRALEIAAAGGHNLLFVGPPGGGKTMLARRLPGLLPPLAPPEALAVAKIHSLVAIHPEARLAEERPFRAPHTSVSTAGLVGGGTSPRPGEVSLAHAGVLFLDELPEFRRDALEALRQPLEEGRVTIVRARAQYCFPARFALLAAMNPCPCGYLGDERRDCRCVSATLERYHRKLSGPLLDRIDLHVEVAVPSLAELRGGPGETTSVVAARILAARERQRRRFAADHPTPVNAALPDAELERHCQLEGGAERLLARAWERLGLSARAFARLLRVARTLADLEGRDPIGTAQVAEALQYRPADPLAGPGQSHAPRSMPLNLQQLSKSFRT